MCTTCLLLFSLTVFLGLLAKKTIVKSNVQNLFLCVFFQQFNSFWAHAFVFHPFCLRCWVWFKVSIQFYSSLSCFLLSLLFFLPSYLSSFLPCFFPCGAPVFPLLVNIQIIVNILLFLCWVLLASFSEINWLHVYFWIFWVQFFYVMLLRQYYMIYLFYMVTLQYKIKKDDASCSSCSSLL